MGGKFLKRKEKFFGEGLFSESFFHSLFINFSQSEALSRKVEKDIFQRKKLSYFPKNILIFFVFVVFLSLPSYAEENNVFSVNRHAELAFSAGAVSVTYTVEISDVPAIDETRIADSDGNGDVDETEKKIYFLALAKRVMDGLRITIGNQQVELKLQSMQGDFFVVSDTKKKVKADFWANASLVPDWRGGSVTVVDAVFSDKIGAREIIVLPPPGWKVTAEGKDGGSGKIHFQGPHGIGPWSVNFVLERLIQPVVISTQEEPAEGKNSEKGGIGNLLEESNASLVTFAIVIAFIVGVFHSLTPGHGRDMLSAYLVGNRGTLKHAALFGWIVTAIRTTPVFSMGIVIVLLDMFILPDILRMWLKILCALAVTAVGIGITVWNFAGNISSDKPLPIGISLSELVGVCIMSSLIPSPSAIALLLGASAAGYPLLGLGLVVSFGFGLQAMMTLNGYMALRLPPLSDKIDEIIERNRRTPMMWGIIIIFAGIVLLTMNL